MAITKAKKIEILAALKSAVGGARAAVFVRFTGLSVAEANELRASLKKDGVKYAVVKKTLLVKALTEAGIAGDQPDLPGEVAMAYLPASLGDDPTTPARGLNEFVKKFKDKLMFLGGMIEKRFSSKEETAAIAAIPPMPVLRGMFATIINSPIQRFAIALGQVTTKKV